MQSIEQRIAGELNCRGEQVSATVALLDGGATVPFIARYRKEATGGLDDTQLRGLEERLVYLRELEDRRETVLRTIAEQDRLTPELEQAVRAAETRTRLEDLYLPYKPRRRTRAQIAREAGLEPLAEALFDDPALDPQITAQTYLAPDQGIATAEDALDGARQILMERLSEEAELLTRLRTLLWEKGRIRALVQEDRKDSAEAARFRDYFDHAEALAAIPSHRALALFRGRKEGVLQVSMTLPDELAEADPHPCVALVTDTAGWRHRQRPGDDWLARTLQWTWKVKLAPRMETELLGQVRERAEAEAIQVFSRNVRSVLMAPPAGPRVTMGLDPGLRTGVKVVVVDGTGKLLDKTTIHPHAPQKKWKEAAAVLRRLCEGHGVELVAVGNGTASRETDKLVREVTAASAERTIQSVMVNEAGASVYSASEIAAREFPKLDVSYRGAVSIARRLQDPLAELVKIEPKSIGVGQYQHDVGQTQLARSLDAVVEDCVNAVGVDANTASAPLLARIAGLNGTVAGNIVSFRDKHGPFASREQLKQVPRLGEKTFEQAAGFLRVMNADNPLDASSVHPEAYSLVERIATDHQRRVADLIADESFVQQLDPHHYIDERFGLPTVRDILAELIKPGRDPRPEFRAPRFREGVETIDDLESGMMLEGVVSNVTNFGAFVDLGVHQDGLVHVSALAGRFVSDPHEVVSPGDLVKVKVVEVDRERKRISLTMRTDEPSTGKPGQSEPKGKAKERTRNGNRGGRKNGSPGKAAGKRSDTAPQPAGAMAAAFARARQNDGNQSD